MKPGFRMKLDAWVARTLEELPFVEWDRFIENTCPDGVYTQVFGWIEREEDRYKDFVVLEFYHWNREVVFVCTSSVEYSKKIPEILYGDVEEHAECRRVEDRFDVENAVRVDADESMNGDSR